MTSSTRRNNVAYFFTGVDLLHPLWPQIVGSDCELEPSEHDQLIREFFPGRACLQRELAELCRYIVTTFRTADNTAWLPLEQLASEARNKLIAIGRLVMWTEFREWYKGSLLLPMCSYWLSTGCEDQGDHTDGLDLEDFLDDEGERLQALLRRRVFGQAYLRPCPSILGSSKRGCVAFCIRSPQSFTQAPDVDFPMLPKTLQSAACLMGYASRMFHHSTSDSAADGHHSHRIDQVTGKLILYIHPTNWALVRPSEYERLMRIIRQHAPYHLLDQHGPPSDDAGRDGEEHVGAHFALMPDDPRVVRDILSCLRIWYVGDQGKPLDPLILEGIADTIVGAVGLATTSPPTRGSPLQHVIGALQKVVAEYHLESTLRFVGDQPNSGFQALRAEILRIMAPRCPVVWRDMQTPEWVNTLAALLAAISEGDYAMRVLMRLSDLLRSRTTASHDLRGDQAAPTLAHETGATTARQESVKAIVQAINECHRQYFVAFQSRLIEQSATRLNQELVACFFQRIRLGIDMAPVKMANTTRGRRNTHQHRVASTDADITHVAATFPELSSIPGLHRSTTTADDASSWLQLHQEHADCRSQNQDSYSIEGSTMDLVNGSSLAILPEAETFEGSIQEGPDDDESLDAVEVDESIGTGRRLLPALESSANLPTNSTPLSLTTYFGQSQEVPSIATSQAEDEESIDDSLPPTGPTTADENDLLNLTPPDHSLSSRPVPSSTISNLRSGLKCSTTSVGEAAPRRRGSHHVERVKVKRVEFHVLAAARKAVRKCCQTVGPKLLTGIVGASAVVLTLRSPPSRPVSINGGASGARLSLQWKSLPEEWQPHESRMTCTGPTAAQASWQGLISAQLQSGVGGGKHYPTARDMTMLPKNYKLFYDLFRQI